MHDWHNDGVFIKATKSLKIVVLTCYLSHSLKGSVWSKKSFPFFAENMIIRSILNLWWLNRTFLIWGTRELEFNDDHRRGGGFANI